MRALVFVLWCLLGFCSCMAGCRARLAAEKLEASLEVDAPQEIRLPGVEVRHDQSIDGPSQPGPFTAE